MRLLALALVSAVFANDAVALSCMRPNLAETFNRLQKSEKVYHIFVGSVRITSKIPKYIDGKPRRVKARFRGRFMGLNGLLPEETVPVTIQTECAGPWCGGLPTKPSTQYLAFLHKTPNGDVLGIGPCPGILFASPSQKQIDLVKRCLKRGACSEADVKRLQLR